jgi:hypothetical protein
MNTGTVYSKGIPTVPGVRSRKWRDDATTKKHENKQFNDGVINDAITQQPTGRFFFCFVHDLHQVHVEPIMIIFLKNWLIVTFIFCAAVCDSVITMRQSTDANDGLSRQYFAMTWHIVMLICIWNRFIVVYRVVSVEKISKWPVLLMVAIGFWLIVDFFEW